MSKELSPLEALKELVYGQECIKGSNVEERLYHIIETALKDYEFVKQDFESMRNFKYKQLDALEIIKTKRVDVNDLLLFVDLKCYNEYVIACDDNKKRVLTKQEYNLLKEVLL